MKILICGTRRKGYEKIVEEILDQELHFELIEGCCPDSADQYAEDYCNARKIKVHYHPASSGNYLYSFKRNIEMVERCDKVIAFWNGYSYGTAQTIAQAVLQGKPIRVVRI